MNNSDIFTIDISEIAQVHFAKFIAKQAEGTCLRVFVNTPGTPRAECGVSLCSKDEIAASDIHLEYEGFKVVVDKKSSNYLDEATIDFEKSDVGSQLMLKAPNAHTPKVGPDAPLAEQIEYLFNSEINPDLAEHGGYLSLVEITEEGIAILEFGGGCNGCTQVGITIREGIEKVLITRFPEQIKGVKDITEHQAGEHSYY